MIALVATSVALASASVGAGASPAALSVTPAHVRLAAGGRGGLLVTNVGSARVVVVAGPAGYALDLRGRPVIADRIATRLVVEPRRFALPPGRGRRLSVRAALPPGSEPGEHDGLVLLTTQPVGAGRLSVSVQVGVVVDVRVPGKIVRRLVLRSIRVHRGPNGHTVRVVVVNRGNVSEALAPRISLVRRGHVVARLAPLRPGRGPQKLLPRTSGLVEALYRGALRGHLVVLVELRQPSGATVRRRFAVVL